MNFKNNMVYNTFFSLVHNCFISFDYSLLIILMEQQDMPGINNIRNDLTNDAEKLTVRHKSLRFLDSTALFFLKYITRGQSNMESLHIFVSRPL